MFSLLIKEVMDPNRMLVLPPDTTVTEAGKLMALKNIGAAMVVERDRLVGIFTERDALFRVTACDRDPVRTPLDVVMTRELFTVSPDQSYGYALLMMYERGFRHAPVIENGRVVGIVSSRNAMDPALEEFSSEMHRREHLRREAIPLSALP